MSHYTKHFFSATLFILAYAQGLSQPPPVQWNKTYGGSSPEEFGIVIQTFDGGYLSAGSSKSAVSGIKSQPNYDASLVTSDYWIVKSDPSGNVQWEKRYGGNSQDVCTYMAQTTDGGFILGGYSTSAISGDKTEPQIASADYWILRLDASGIKIFDKVFGGDGNDYLTSVIQNTTGGFLFAGFSSSNVSGDKTQPSRGANDFWLVCTDALGNKLWDKTLGGSDNDYARCVQQTTDGGYLVGGNSQSGISGDKTENNRGPSLTSDYWIVKIDEVGNKQWDKRYGSSEDDILTSFVQTSDGGYALGGFSAGGVSFDKSNTNRGGYDYWVVKVNSIGTKQWDKRFGSSMTDYLYSLQATADGGFIFAGSSDSPNGGDKSENIRAQEDYWIVKTNASGVKQWDKTLGGYDEDWLSSIRQTSDGGYILGGRSQSNAGAEKTQGTYGTTDFWIIKLGPDPVLPIMLSDFSGKQSGTDRIHLRWSTATEINNSFFTIEKLEDGNYSALLQQPGAGNSTSELFYEAYDEHPAEGVNYYRLRQTDYDGRSEAFGPIAVSYDPLTKKMLSTYPNPATDYITIEWDGMQSSALLNISGLEGNQVYTQILAENLYTIRVPLSNFAKGIYVASIISDGNLLQQKFEVK